LPNFGVTSIGEMWTISSEGVTPPSSLLRAHVPLPLGSPLLQHLASFEESLQVVRSPCCPRELPDAISESLSLDAGSPTPAVHRVPSPVSSTVSSAFPRKPWVGFRICPTNHDFSQGGISRLQIFRNVPASKFARPPDRSYRCDTAAGQPGLLRPGLSCFVTSARSGYANRPNQAIDGTGTFTPLDSQHCRLLRFRSPLFRSRGGCTFPPWLTFPDAPL
jgi:hypothetical protein